ncbi:MerR family DNA-binding transcriptional regulator [Paraclostridium sordellii]|uniref:MerR family DNA-binding transcriptional regulator n=1 Tax=Paraclostridium sordellii TaxID=1505 RepID=UPI0005E2E451|nr:MerR family DNA-binding transcriptional regulator [Paeniclostridium sordellii]CEO20468.1 MerR family transcriptional regulator [[Clostridium] sordellii] [Paeniclostridium sordellii]
MYKSKKDIKVVIIMKNLFSIGEVSKIKGVIIKALRYYHKMGILIPRYIDNTTGYRYYSINQFILYVSRDKGKTWDYVKEVKDDN